MQKEQSNSLYDVLYISSTASFEEIKAAYRNLALKYHPDRNKDTEAKSLFQQIGRAYEILSDKQKRLFYDSTGSCDLEELKSSKDWEEYFKNLYNKVSQNSIEEFKKTYVGSVDEYEDILSSYMNNKGDLLQVIDDVFFTSSTDINRIEKIIKKAISKNIIPSFKKFESGIEKTKLKKRQKREAKEAIESSFRNEDLIKTIQKRKNQSLPSLIENLEQKYSNTSSQQQRKKRKLV